MKCDYPNCDCSRTEMCSQPNLHQMITEQNPERRKEPRKPLELRAKPMVEGGFYNSAGVEATPEQIAEQRNRKPVTSLDWELLQAIQHLQNAISVTDHKRGHLLQAAMMITKGARESE